MELHQGSRVWDEMAPGNNSTQSSIVGFPMEALDWCRIGDIWGISMLKRGCWGVFCVPKSMVGFVAMILRS